MTIRISTALRRTAATGNRVGLRVGALSVLLFALVLPTAEAGATGAPWSDGSSARNDRGGVVYVMTNATSGNAVLVFVRDRRGRLQALPWATASTGGMDNYSD